MGKFVVPIIYEGMSNFIVEAETKEEAEEAARTAFREGAEPDKLCNEWEHIRKTGQIEQIDGPRYSHQFSVAFTVVAPVKDPDGISLEDLVEALVSRIDDIEKDKCGIGAFQHEDVAPVQG
jgi:hypothetical protein